RVAGSGTRVAFPRVRVAGSGGRVAFSRRARVAALGVKLQMRVRGARSGRRVAGYGALALRAGDNTRPRTRKPSPRIHKTRPGIRNTRPQNHNTRPGIRTTGRFGRAPSRPQDHEHQPADQRDHGDHRHGPPQKLPEAHTRSHRPPVRPQHPTGRAPFVDNGLTSATLDAIPIALIVPSSGSTPPSNKGAANGMDAPNTPAVDANAEMSPPMYAAANAATNGLVPPVSRSLRKSIVPTLSSTPTYVITPHTSNTADHGTFDTTSAYALGFTNVSTRPTANAVNPTSNPNAVPATTNTPNPASVNTCCTD